MTDINSGEYVIKGSKRRRSEVQDGATYIAQTKGGEIDDHVREADRLIPRDPSPYRDDDLTGAGYSIRAKYDYTDAHGDLLYQSVRYEHRSVPDKKFRQRRAAPAGSGVAWVADAGLVKVPYGWPELVRRPSEPVYWCEGEKDADRLTLEGLLATTAAGQQWSPVIAKILKGRNIVILEDNDDAGRKHAAKAEAALKGFAAATKRIALPGLAPTEDVSDWLDAGHTIDELREIVDATKPSGVRASPAGWFDPKTLPRRQWIYPPHYIRQFVSLLIATGGVGKSSLAIAEAIAMVTGMPLLGVQPKEPVRVWLWNGEDPTDELRRRVAAACSLYEVKEAEIGNRLFLNSGRDMPIVIAEEDGRTIKVDERLITELITTIRDNKIDVVVIDPFVSTHRVSENNNAAIDRVAKIWARIADVANCSVMLVHHSRKTNGGDAVTVQDARGASALHDAARSARVLIPMTKDEADGAKIAEQERRFYFRADNGKANLAPPPEAADWFKLISVNLENGPGFETPGDNVGVVGPWKYPRADVPVITPALVMAAQAAISIGGPWRADARSKSEPWAGVPIAKVFGFDLTLKPHERATAKIIEQWRATGWLKAEERPDKYRKTRRYIVAGVSPAPVGATGAGRGEPE